MTEGVPTPTPAPAEETDDGGSYLPLMLLAPVGGAIAGLVCALFRLVLTEADDWRVATVTGLKGDGSNGLLLVVGASAAAAGLATWLVRRYAIEAGGSGIPHVEAVLRGELKASGLLLVPVKFVGGLLAIGSGLALGREGPSVQMGATISEALGRLYNLSRADCRVLLAAGAGAGLATAFNAPMGGAIFVLEELVRRFETRIAIAALAASASAIIVSHAILGSAPDFRFPAVTVPEPTDMWLYVVLGTLAGFAAVAYNKAVLGALALNDSLAAVPASAKAAVIGGVVGVIGWYAPRLIGGGDTLTQSALLGEGMILSLALLFLARFALGALSYAAGTPGGLFAPLLVLGAQLGLVVGVAFDTMMPAAALEKAGFAVVGMAALFAGVVRAPLTGIALVLEMTASATMLLPVLAACFMAMLVPTALRNPPIYDSLGLRTARLAARQRGSR
ncbi:H(+)/Cl(-) exchange transporter ClcA [Acuticoccus mangrovi]|uniref:H(+)/Cl(-) exchange transporter ClcA n=1 Tax=Acuticoccus mangrovi TaxID=2796142 RepID=A0A934MNS7_9HYPH|nr:H(+)/Cl(-) exchange transporter ClcA [Acuticoccus mangrovi]MBJ3778469.1 H(+)/Cl(-) exchange transporter ClcA [Acuticoccus mangrovi]